MNKTIITVIIVVLVGTGSFYGGMKYGENKASSNAGPGFGQLQNLTPEQRQQRMQQFQQNGGQRRGGANFAGGEIISRDDKSITVKLQDGGSKIIFYSSSTTIGKMAMSTPNDLSIGENVMANGTANSDGSITAQQIQIRPNIPSQPQPPKSQ